MQCLLRSGFSVLLVDILEHSIDEAKYLFANQIMIEFYLSTTCDETNVLWSI